MGFIKNKICRDEVELRKEVSQKTVSISKDEVPILILNLPGGLCFVQKMFDSESENI